MKTLPIVGAKHRPPAEDVLNLLAANTPLVLRRQPENPYDVNAVQVMYQPDDETDQPPVLALLAEYEITGDCHLGFIPREAAAQLAPIMDQWAEGKKPNEWPSDWPATLTFSSTGRPMVSFDAPSPD